MSLGAWSGLEYGLGRLLLTRASYIVPAALVASLTATAMPTALLAGVLPAVAVLLAIAGSGVALMPSLNSLTRRTLHRLGAVAGA